MRWSGVGFLVDGVVFGGFVGGFRVWLASGASVSVVGLGFFPGGGEELVGVTPFCCLWLHLWWFCVGQGRQSAWDIGGI